MTGFIDGLESIFRDIVGDDEPSHLAGSVAEHLENARAAPKLGILLAHCQRAMDCSSSNETRAAILSLLSEVVRKIPATDMRTVLPAIVDKFEAWSMFGADEVKQWVAEQLYRACSIGTKDARVELLQKVCDRVPLETHFEFYMQTASQAHCSHAVDPGLARVLQAFYIAREGLNARAARQKAIGAASRICLDLAVEAKDISRQLAILEAVLPATLEDRRTQEVLIQRCVRLSEYEDVTGEVFVRVMALLCRFKLDSKQQGAAIRGIVHRILHDSVISFHRMADLIGLMEIEQTPLRAGTQTLTKILDKIGAIRSFTLTQQECFFKLFQDSKAPPHLMQRLVTLLCLTPSDEEGVHLFREKMIVGLERRMEEGAIQDVTAYLSAIAGYQLSCEEGKQRMIQSTDAVLDRLWSPEVWFEPELLAHLFTAIRVVFTHVDPSEVEPLRAKMAKLLVQPFDVSLKRLRQQPDYAAGHYLRYGRILIDLAGEMLESSQERQRVVQAIVLHVRDASLLEFADLVKVGQVPDLPAISCQAHAFLDQAQKYAIDPAVSIRISHTVKEITSTLES